MTVRTCFVILHYLAADITCQCLDSILSLDGAADVNVVVVDNCSPDLSGELLRKKYAGEHRIHFLSMDSNEGFARGNNAGYRYALEHFDPDFVVVMNNDVILDDREFANKIGAAYMNSPFAVLGPDIVTVDGRHQNPLRERPMTLKETVALRRKMRIKLAFLPLFHMLGMSERPCGTEVPTPHQVESCVLHGACYIFSRDFTSVRPYAFNPETFLYCEEDILSAECLRAELAVRYSPALKVRHLEDRSTLAASRSAYSKARAKYRNLVHSLDVLARTADGPIGRLEKNIMCHLPCLLSDRKYIELKWKSKMGYELDLDNPVSFNEKIQWLKLNDRRDDYAMMSDKASVKEYVASIIGSEHVIPTIGVYERAADIPFDSLPQKFVLKCTHDSGSVIVCRDRSSFDAGEARAGLDRALGHSHYAMYREWCYKNIKPRILCEQYMSDDRQDGGLVDYKFFCFNGAPEFLYISQGLEDHATAYISFCDLQGKEMPFRRSDYRTFPGTLPLPCNFDAMKEMVSSLAKAVGNRFVRVDMYEISGTVYFSEFTFYPNGGFIPFRPRKWDFALGSRIVLQ